jgi:hypothetical protein
MGDYSRATHKPAKTRSKDSIGGTLGGILDPSSGASRKCRSLLDLVSLGATPPAVFVRVRDSVPICGYGTMHP